MLLRIGFVFICFMIASTFSGLSFATESNRLAPLKLEGSFVQGGIVRGQVPTSASVFLANEELVLSKSGYFVFGFSRDETKQVTLKVIYENGQSWQKDYQVAAREFDIQRIDGLPQQTVTPDPKVLAKIREDNEAVWLARQHITDREDFAQSFIWPAQGRISGVYGSQRILNGAPRTPHYGLDIAAPKGAAVVAPASGIVRLAHPDMVLSGGTLILDHGQGFFSTFLHLSQIDVEVGQEVKQGDKIAEVGATGRATGPHLDWRINWGQVRLDPYYLVEGSDN